MSALLHRPCLLRFGIPSLDRLVTGESAVVETKSDLPSGIVLDEVGSVSLSIVGPDGTGKSVLGLHLASRYITDCFERRNEHKLPVVFYVSTDLNYEIAENRLWKAFHLEKPNQRMTPFARFKCYGSTRSENSAPNVELRPLKPLRASSEDLDRAREDAAQFLFSQTSRQDSQAETLKIGFIDLARNTAGDDWSYLTHLLALLPTPEDGAPRHLVVIDAVEGFETLVGEKDKFGELASRRARIAQLMRLATLGNGKSHTAFIVGSHTPDEKLPEVFITDFVIRLREVESNGYIRRTVQVEKARGYSHARGQHPYVIRSGNGSSTGAQENFDDPALGEGERRQAYFHVFRSLHYLSRTTMQHKGSERPQLEPTYAGFGIHYLDEMLAGTPAPAKRIPRTRTDSSGLPSGSVTGLIGDSETRKSALGRIFLSRAFAQYSETLENLIQVLPESRGNQNLRESLKWPANVENLEEVIASPEAYYEQLKQRRRFSNFVRRICETYGVQERAPQVFPILFATLLLDSSPAHSEEGVPILLTTHDVDNAALARDFSRFLATDGSGEDFWPNMAKRLRVNSEVLRECVEYHFATRSLCRRLEIHDLSSPILMHIVQSYVQRAQRMQVGAEKRSEESDRRMVESIGIRMVIEDFSVLRAIYPEVRTENLFLPYLLFYLRREGITTLIINTDPERPGADCRDRFEQEFRSLVDYRLFSWHVPFFGEDRLAIAAIPPFGTALVRELRAATDESAGLSVDPEFELYTGLEQGKPEAVPLEIRLFQETSAFEHYIRRENLVYSKRFRPVPGQKDVIVGQAREEYDVLRDWCSLQSPQNLSHTLVLQIDEFWGARAKPFRQQGAYLNAVTVQEDGTPVAAVDTSGLFQVSEAMKTTKKQWRRFEFFQPNGYSLKVPSDQKTVDIDRIPFTWDFGFMLCRERCWIDAAEKRLSFSKNGEQKLTVGHVWNSLTRMPSSFPDQELTTHRTDVRGITYEPKELGEDARSWRAFLEACQLVARVRGSKTSATLPAFDLSLLTPESFSCLVLEMWASQMFKQSGELASELSRESGNRHDAESGPPGMTRTLANWLVGDSYRRTIQKDYEAWIQGSDVGCNRGWLALYKVWLLLAEVLRLEDFVEPAQSLEFKPREGNHEAVAIRHWYKTAAARSDEFDPSDPVLPCRLPGNFSVRGDWFLAVLKGSLSNRLADQALDLLSSKRANRIRMQMGLGLPTRFPTAPESERDTPNELVRIRLFKCGLLGERERASYRDILKIGQDRKEGFHWLWRSRIREYDRHARILQRWIGRTLLFWNRVRHDRGRDWISGFSVYDALENGEGVEFCEQKSVQSLKMFAIRCDFLLAELRDATLVSGR
jgi:KaiC/GvpD/RAD55 family RecA-like ATPase